MERLLNDHNINYHPLLVYIQYKASLSAKPWAQTNPNLKRHVWTLSVTQVLITRDAYIELQSLLLSKSRTSVTDQWGGTDRWGDPRRWEGTGLWGRGNLDWFFLFELVFDSEFLLLLASDAFYYTISPV